MKHLLIVKVGDTFAQLSEKRGDFEHWIADRLGQLKCPVAVHDPRRQEPLPCITDIAGAVITGSHDMVTDRKWWSEKLARWLPALIEHEVPVLGICYGHQLLAHALGGDVDYRTNGREVGTVRIVLEEKGIEDPLFENLHENGEFLAHAFHSQCVLRLPPGAILLARSELEPHAAFRFGSCAWGVQFHPEFCSNVMSDYVHCLRSELTGEGHDVAALLQGLASTDAATRILQRFGSLVEKRYLISCCQAMCE